MATSAGESDEGYDADSVSSEEELILMINEGKVGDRGVEPEDTTGDSCSGDERLEEAIIPSLAHLSKRQAK